MFGLFKKKPLLTPDSEQWIWDTFKWAFKNFSADVFYNETILVCPTPEFFPDELSRAGDFAAAVFELVKDYSGMSDWHCRLVAQESEINSVANPLLMLRREKYDPSGTFQMKDREITITYKPSLLKEPEKLIATLAHELAHFLSAPVIENPPGGAESWEHATDLLAVVMGFGIFLSNSAFSFNQYTDGEYQGWSTQSQGYMSQYELIYALSIFCSLKNISTVDVLPYVKCTLRAEFKQAMKEVAGKQQLLDGLKQIDENRYDRSNG